jgi:hypothetical protein
MAEPCFLFYNLAEYPKSEVNEKGLPAPYIVILSIKRLY